MTFRLTPYGITRKQLGNYDSLSKMVNNTTGDKRLAPGTLVVCYSDKDVAKAVLDSTKPDFFDKDRNGYILYYLPHKR
jgi:hypothetical protein